MILPEPQDRYDKSNEVETRRILDLALAALAPQAGTYIPTITSGGGGETVTYSTQLGLWWRLGSLVLFSADVTLATKSGGSGDIHVSLPAQAASGITTPVSVWVDDQAAGWTGAPMAQIGSTEVVAVVRELVAGVATSAWAKLGATGSVRVAGAYMAAL